MESVSIQSELDVSFLLRGFNSSVVSTDCRHRAFLDPTRSDHVQPGLGPHHPGRDDPERPRRGEQQEPRPRSAHRHQQDGGRMMDYRKVTPRLNCSYKRNFVLFE